MKNAIFWDGTLCGSCKNQHFRGTYPHHHQDEKNQLGTTLAIISSVLQLLLTNNIPSSQILFIMMMEALYSYETLVTLHSHHDDTL
jgi:hypothetical protein